MKHRYYSKWPFPPTFALVCDIKSQALLPLYHVPLVLEKKPIMDAKSHSSALGLLRQVWEIRGQEIHHQLSVNRVRRHVIIFQSVMTFALSASIRKSRERSINKLIRAMYISGFIHSAFRFHVLLRRTRSIQPCRLHHVITNGSICVTGKI